MIMLISGSYTIATHLSNLIYTVIAFRKTIALDVFSHGIISSQTTGRIPWYIMIFLTLLILYAVGTVRKHFSIENLLGRSQTHAR